MHTLMAPDPTTIRFAVGKTYRLHSSPGLPNFLGGTMKVIAELSPRNQWGSRSLLADVSFAPTTGCKRNKSRLGVQCFVEEGFAEVRNSRGSRMMPVEIATLTGLYPDKAKAYANAELHRGGFIPITTIRTVA